MNTRILGLAALLAFSAGSGAMAQAAADPAATQAAALPVAAGAVGHWLRDPQGHIIGSVRSLTDGGRTAVIMVGSYFQAGSHEARISSSALSMLNGNVTLRPETVQALNTTPLR